MGDFLTGHLPQLYFMAVLLGLSASFSGSETALFSLRPAELNACRRRKDLRDRCLLTLREEMTDVLTTILLGNLIVNILYFSTAAQITLAANKALSASWAVGISACFLLVLIIGGEVLPKSVGSAVQLPVCRLVAVPLWALHRIFTPFCFCLRKIVNYCKRALFPPAPPDDIRENTHLLFENYREEGIVTAEEYSFLSTVIDLNHIRVREMMTPRVEMAAVGQDATPEEILTLARETRHSKIPVRGRENDQLVGWVDARDFFFSDRPAAIKNKLRPLLFFSEYTSAEKALRGFLEHDIPMAAVVDEHGADVGILVLTDIIAEIFGEFGEGKAPAAEPIRQESDGTSLLDSSVSVRALKDIIGTETRMPGVATIGGLVTAMLGRTAKVGDTVRIGRVNLTVREVFRRRPKVIELKADE